MAVHHYLSCINCLEEDFDVSTTVYVSQHTKPHLIFVLDYGVTLPSHVYGILAIVSRLQVTNVFIHIYMYNVNPELKIIVCHTQPV